MVLLKYSRLNFIQFLQSSWPRGELGLQVEWLLHTLKTRRANAQMTHIQVQNYNKKSKCLDNLHASVQLQKMIVTTHKYTTFKQSILFNVCSNHAPLEYSGQESKVSVQFMILAYL